MTYLAVKNDVGVGQKPEEVFRLDVSIYYLDHHDFFFLFLAMGLINKCHMLALLQSATVCVLLLCLLVLMYLIITCNDQMLTMQMNGIKSYDFLYKVIYVCSFIRLGDM